MKHKSSLKVEGKLKCIGVDKNNLLLASESNLTAPHIKKLDHQENTFFY